MFQAALLLGKQVDRVRISNGPSTEPAERIARMKGEGESRRIDRTMRFDCFRAAGPMGRRLPCKQKIGVQFPGGPLLEGKSRKAKCRSTEAVFNLRTSDFCILTLPSTDGVRSVAVSARPAVNREVTVQLRSNTPWEESTND